MQGTEGEQLPISVISSMTGVNPVTLRAWERRYGLIQPLRTPKGHRLYTHRHVEQIRRALTLVERGVPISKVRDLLDADTTPVVVNGARNTWNGYIERMTGAIARFDEFELDRVYDEAISIHSVDRVAGQLLLPLLMQLGERWNRAAGGVAEEHFFATYMRSKLGARLMHRMRYAVGPKLVAACAPGEQHEIGLMLFAIEAHANDMKTILLGANTPFDEVIIAQKRAAGDAIVISASTELTPELLADDLPRLVKQSAVPVFMGGSMATRLRKAVTAAGAIPLTADLRESVRVVKAEMQKREASP